MEELVNFVIAIIFVSIAIIFKLIEVFSRKKGTLPFPEIILEKEPQMEGKKPVFYEEEQKPVPKIQKEIKSYIKEKAHIKPEVVTYQILPQVLSKDELQRGVILSTILGPPKALSKIRIP